MKKIILFFLICHLQNLLHAQLDSIYMNLDTTQLTTNFFWDEKIDADFPPNIYADDTIDVKRANEIINQLHRFQIHGSSTDIPSFRAIHTASSISKQSTGILPLTIIDLRYNHIDTNAVMSGNLFHINNQIFQIPNQNVFAESQLLITHLDLNEVGNNTYRFKLSEENFIHNYEEFPDLIKIDFGDGQGYRTLTFNQTITVYYSVNTANPIIRTQIFRGDETHQGAMILKWNICTSDYPAPDINSPFPNDGTIDFPWLITTNYNGVSVCGNAYPSVNGPFDKPIIIVEGIDFNRERSAERNGDFGWCQLTSGIDHPTYDYAMLARMPEFLTEVSQHGYDIILLDFCDGATYMENNGQLLVHLLELVNQHKTGNEPVILAGASMGGQIARYALSYMEENEMPHCARLYLSLDSPHEGANIPMSIQQAIHLMSDRSADAQEFVDDYFNRPATKQLLKALYNPNLPPQEWYDTEPHLEWYSQMHQWGLPKLCRNVAITNGELTGHGLSNDHPGSYGPVDPIISYSCEKLATSSGPEARIFIANSNGDPYYNQQGVISANGMNVSAHITITDMEATKARWQTYLLGYLGQFIIPIKTHYIAKVPHDAILWDFAPGGTRTTAKDLVGSINADGSLQDGGCNMIEEYLKKHCFIPTTSALAIPTNTPNLSANSILSPFDYKIGPMNINEPHTFISQENLEFMLNEVLLGENSDGSSLIHQTLTSSSGTFNLGLQGLNFIRDCNVTAFGKLAINSEYPLHYGNNNYPLINSHFKVFTLAHCAASHVVVDNGGVLEMGSDNLNTTAELRLMPESSLTIGDNGHLKMAPNCSIIVEKDAELIFHTAADIELDGAQILVKKGGKIIVRLSPGSDNIALVQLMKDNSSIIFEGGDLIIEDFAILQTDATSSTGGFIEFKGQQRANLSLGQNSKFHLIGQDKNDLILRIVDGNNLWTNHGDQGCIELNNGFVDLSNGGVIWTKHKLLGANLNIEDTQATVGIGLASIHVTHQETCNFYNCDFNKVVLDTWHTQSSIHTCSFRDSETALRVSEGSFHIHNSSFNRANIKSNSLAHMSLIESTEFRNIHDYYPIQDESLVELRIIKSTFVESEFGIYKIGGKLSLKCSHFNDILETAVELNQVHLNCSSSDGGGYNSFQNVKGCILLNHAIRLDLSEGYNDFSGYNDYCIQGSLTGRHLCDNCESWKDASYNYWGSHSPYYNGVMSSSGLITPESGEVNLSIYYVPQGSNYCNMLTPMSLPMGCQVILYDNNPVYPQDCGSGKPVVRKQKNMITQTGKVITHHGMQLRDETMDTSNPLLYTEHYYNVTLDSALVNAASHMLIYDSLGNDAIAAERFHEILTSGLDRNHPEIRWRMQWGQSQMKSCIESLFVHDLLAAQNNQDAFEQPVQHYVDVLNIMTDTLLTDSTYKEQFYLELDKGQLLRTIGKTMMAREAYVHLDDCQLDAPEQAALNNWLYEVDQELSIGQQYLEEQLSPNEIIIAVDTTNYEVPATFESSNYYFGMWINSPNDLTFMTCGGDPEFRILQSKKTVSHWQLYPNPTTSVSWLKGKLMLGTLIDIFDIHGKIISHMVIDNDDQDVYLMDSVDGLSSGVYQVQIRQGDLRETLRLIKE